MFGGNNFTELDLSNFSMNLVKNIRSMFNSMPNLETLNISNWHLDSVTNKSTVFNGTTKLKTIYLNNSDANTINLIISILLSRSVSDPGVIYIVGVDDISQVNITTAESKNWVVEIGN
jgi:surface protein